MDAETLTAYLSLAGAIIGGTFLIYRDRDRDRRSYQAEFVDDVVEDRRVIREEHAKCLAEKQTALDKLEATRAALDVAVAENRQCTKERDDSIAAASHALVRLGTIEAYAHELEDRLGIPHREWIDDMDTQPQTEGGR